MKRLTKELANYLIDEDFVRPPTESAIDNPNPVIFVEPNQGAVSPTDLKNDAATDITLTLQTSGGFGTNPYEGFLDRRTVVLTYRCKPGKEKDLFDLSNSIDAALDDQRAFIMGDLRVEIAQIYTPLQLQPTSNPEQSSDYNSEYVFLIRKESLQD
jgi:hypothetical protein